MDEVKICCCGEPVTAAAAPAGFLTWSLQSMENHPGDGGHSPRRHQHIL